VKGYFTIKEDKEFCGRYFEAGLKYHIIKNTDKYILIKSDKCQNEQMMTKLWLEKGMFNFLDFHEE
jgi:hypothetical protein